MIPKMINYEAEWTPTGGIVRTNSDKFNCPRCKFPIKADVEHRCGDRAPAKKTAAKKKASK